MITCNKVMSLSIVTVFRYFFVLPRPQSLAITGGYLSVFELIIKESGDEGSDGKGEKANAWQILIPRWRSK